MLENRLCLSVVRVVVPCLDQTLFSLFARRGNAAAIVSFSSMSKLHTLR